MISQALEKAASSAGMSLEELEKIPKGKTRKIHDDITVIVLDLEGQYKWIGKKKECMDGDLSILM